MSNQDSAYPPYGNNNPWSTEESQGAPAHLQPQQQPQEQQQYGGYAPPPGPPPGQYGAAPGQQTAPPGQYGSPSGGAPGLPTRRSDTFRETDFIPESQRGEQREAMQQFEMNKSGTESQTDRDVAQLQQEFPGIDGSLIAALYSDSGNMGATKEMLMELASQTEGAK